MNNFKNIIDNLLKPSHKSEAWKLKLIKEWPQVIGNLHKKVSLQKVHNTSVVLGVHDSSWMHELYMLSKLIIKKINTYLNEQKIQTLRFQCLEKKVLHKMHTVEKKIILKHNIHLNQQQESALLKIKDRELSQALKQFLGRCQY